MNSFFLTVVSYLWRFSVALRERSFFISPYLCYPSYLLHLNANRTKMRTIFKGKHFKNGKIERGGGAAPTKVSLLLSFWRICLAKEDFYFYIYTFRISHVQNIEMWKCPQSIANISQINLIFTISEGRRLEQRKAILRSYFSFYFILMFRKRNCIHSLSNALFTPLPLPLSIIRIMYPLVCGRQAESYERFVPLSLSCK